MSNDELKMELEDLEDMVLQPYNAEDLEDLRSAIELELENREN